MAAHPDRKPRDLRQRVRRWPTHGVKILGALILMGSSPALLGEGQETLAFFYMGVAILIVGGWMHLLDVRFDALAIRPEDAPMLPELGDPHGVLVRVWILQGHAVTGEDRGAMWLEDGKLAFCGRRTSFVIARNDVEGGMAKRGPGRFALVFRRNTPGGQLGVSFTPLFGDRPYRAPLEVTIEKWLNGGSSQGTSQYPPTTRGPGAMASGAVRWRLVRESTLGAGAIGLAMFPIAVSFGLVPWLVLILASGVAAWVFAPRSQGRLALRDAKRLEAKT